MSDKLNFCSGAQCWGGNINNFIDDKKSFMGFYDVGERRKRLSKVSQNNFIQLGFFCALLMTSLFGVVGTD